MSDRAEETDESEETAYLGLAEAASLLGVHYMTAYRYVRTGRLAATQRQGRWQVDPSDVVAIQARRPQPGGRHQRRASAARQASAMFERRLIQGDEAGAYAVCQEALGSWARPVDLHVDVVVPAMRRVGDRWEAGDVSVADEHRASSVAVRVVGRLGPHFLHPGRTRGTVVVGTPVGDTHSLPSLIAADLLRAAHHHVVELGADTPAESFVETASRVDRLLAVAVGATLRGNLPAIAATVQALHRGLPGVPVIVGGAGLEPHAASDLGADLSSGPDGRTLVEVVDGLAPVGSA